MTGLEKGAMLWWSMALYSAARGDYKNADEGMRIALFKFLPEVDGHQRPWHNVHRAQEVLDERPDWPGR